MWRFLLLFFMVYCPFRKQLVAMDPIISWVHLMKKMHCELSCVLISKPYCVNINPNEYYVLKITLYLLF